MLDRPGRWAWDMVRGIDAQHAKPPGPPVGQLQMRQCYAPSRIMQQEHVAHTNRLQTFDLFELGGARFDGKMARKQILLQCKAFTAGNLYRMQLRTTHIGETCRSEEGRI